MYCRKCGRNNPEGNHYCVYCGAILDKNPYNKREYIDSAHRAWEERRGRRKRLLIVVSVAAAAAVLVFFAFMCIFDRESADSGQNKETGTSAMQTEINSTEAPSSIPTSAKPTQKQTQAPGKKLYVSEPDGYANVRTGPGTEHEVVGTLNNGDAVVVSNLNNGWYKIKEGQYKGCYISETTLTQNYEDVEDPMAMFDETGWSWIRGQTLGGQSYVRFHKDGTFDEYLLGPDVLIPEAGVFQYDAGILYMTEFDQGSSISADSEEYILEGDRFRTREKHEMQVGEDYYSLDPDDSVLEYF